MPQLIEKARKLLPMGKELDSGRGMILPGFLSPSRTFRPGSHWRAMDLWRIDWPFAPTRWCCTTEGKSCEQVAKS